MIRWSRETIKKFAHKVTHAEGEPKKIGFAMGVGVFIAWFPIPGTHTAMALGGSWLFRLNPAIVFVGSWVNNPFTMIPIWVSGFWLGLALTGTSGVELTMDMDMEAIIDLSKAFFVPFVIGNIVLGTAAGVVAHFLTMHSVRKYRERKALREETGGETEETGDAAPPAIGEGER